MLDEMFNMLKKSYEVVDVLKIQKDISEGKKLIEKCNNKTNVLGCEWKKEVLDYINKIIDDYRIFIAAINFINLSVGKPKEEIFCNEIYLYVNFLEKLKFCKEAKMSIECYLEEVGAKHE